MTEGRRLTVHLEEHHQGRLDKVLAELLSGEHLTRSYLAQLIAKGAVSGPSGILKKPSHNVEGPLALTIELPAAEPLSLEAEDLPLDILFEDQDMVALNKPAGMAVHPGAGRPSGTLVNALLFHIKDLSGIGGVERPGIVHRLDMDTSGLILVAKSDRAHQDLSRQFQERTLQKTYLVWVHGRFEDEVLVDQPIDRDPKERKRMAVVDGGREAQTLFVPRFSSSHLSKVLAKPKTGRTHQIRVHLKYLHRPVLNDALYGGGPQRLPNLPETRSVRSFLQENSRFFLHALSLNFQHPVSGEPMELSAPPPPAFEELEELTCT